MITVSFINPITKQQVVLYPHQVFGVTFLPTNNCTVVTSVGGAAVPVECSIDEAVNKINAALAANSQQKGNTDGV